MRKSSSFSIKILVFCLIMLNIAGCWNRRELDNLAIVSGLAIDKGEESGKIQLTAQILKPGNLSIAAAGGAGGARGAEKPYWNLTETGNTVFETIRALTHKSNRRLFLPHNEIVIFSQDIAKEGIQKYIDFIIRDHELRRLIYVLVSKGKASEILESKTELEQIPAISISQLIEARDATSESSAVNLQEFMNRLMSKTTAPIASLIEVVGKEKTALLMGTAVFKKDKLTGFLDRAETRGLQWVIGEVKSGIIVVECPNGKGKASLEIIRASSKITPEIKDNTLHIKVEINEEGNLGEEMCLADLSKPEVWMSIERRKAVVIRKEVMAALKKAQEWNTDIFGFGDAVHRKYPKLWKYIESQWDDFFPSLEVTVIVKAKLRRSGMITKPAKPE